MVINHRDSKVKDLDILPLLSWMEYSTKTSNVLYYSLMNNTSDVLYYLHFKKSYIIGSLSGYTYTSRLHTVSIVQSSHPLNL